MNDRLLGAVAGLVGALVVLVFFSMNGLSLTSLETAGPAIAVIIFSTIGGAYIFDSAVEDLETKKVVAGMMSFGLGIALVAMIPYASTTYGQVAGYGSQPEAPEPEEGPSYMRGSVIDALSSPTSAISDAEINYYDTEPVEGVGDVSLYSDNTNAQGSFSTELTEAPNSNFWVTASSNGYYSEKDQGQSAKYLSGASDIAFDEYGEGLTKVGSLDWRISDADNPDNVDLSSGDVNLDDGAGPFNFNIVFEDSDSASAIRDLLMEIEEGSGFDENVSVEFELTEVEDPDEGSLSSSITSGEMVWDQITETEIQFDGDLQYRKDIVLNVDIELNGATGTIIEFDSIDDLSGLTGIEGEDGISEESFVIETA